MNDNLVEISNESSVNESKKKVLVVDNSATSIVNLNSIANLNTCKTVLTGSPEKKTRFSNNGISELKSFKSILKRSISNKNNINEDSKSMDKLNYRRDFSINSQFSKKSESIKSNNNNNKKEEDNLDEILINNNHLYKYYITRLKHSLIISFLILMPIQNILLFIITLLSEKVKQFFVILTLTLKLNFFFFQKTKRTNPNFFMNQSHCVQLVYYH